MNVFVVQYNEAGAREKQAALEAAGHAVRVHWSKEAPPQFGAELPNMFVLSLEQLPSHARAVAEWIWEAKKRQHLPIVFVGGQPEKVQTAREKFPRAVFCEAVQLIDTIGRLSLSETPGEGKQFSPDKNRKEGRIMKKKELRTAAKRRRKVVNQTSPRGLRARKRRGVKK